MTGTQVQVGIGCFVRTTHAHKTYFLLGHRHGSHGSGTWGLPGGHLEMGESWATCAQRETHEECGVKTTVPEYCAVTNDVFASDKHYITVFVAADLDQGQSVANCEPEKCKAWVWVSWDEVVAGKAVMRDATNPECFQASEEIDLEGRLFLPVKNLIKQLRGAYPEWLK